MRDRPSTTPRRRLADLVTSAGASGPGVTGHRDVDVTGIVLGSHQVVPGDAFAALPGARAHGARFAGDAAAAGAVAVITDVDGAALLAEEPRLTGVPVVVLDDPRADLGRLSAELYDHPTRSFTTLGVTGTQGKTTTTYLGEAAAGPPAAVVGTIGTRILGRPVASALTTPEAPQLQALFAVMREEGVRTCAMEVSSHALVKRRVDGFAFDVGVFLNLGRDHLDFHRDLDDYFDAKAQLFTADHARRGVVNVDDTFGRRLVDRAEVPVTTFSTEGAVADWRAVNVRSHRLGSELQLVAPDGSAVDVAVPLPGAFNVSNAVAVLVALAGEGRDLGELARGLAASPGVPGRMERVEAGQDFTVVVDYAHKPDAVTAVLRALRPVTAGRLIVVIGAGGDRDTGKRPTMGALAAELADLVVVTDDNPRSEDPARIRQAVLEGARGGPAETVEIGDRHEAIAHAVGTARRGDTVVVAGKGHESGQEIDGVVHPFDDRDVVRNLLEGRVDRS
ncbi:UDP-N-acetylmuramoyl-L-alanyl-D-glutamate--2,6-diaminopimelate ligase [Aeromicrobium sp. Sec7.5]|uniref:UDP-N-acetylmuramoyl-L-alanyl-D-glutamate--2, 6-diaminopimelate ligase n=1 Tax=Aeromicrobium sp. Sec7.5 TaxID=3121276 RepID=UPI003FA5F2C8